MTRVSNTSRPTLVSGKRLNIPLNQLVAQPGNPRRTKPTQDAHRQLVASIRAHGLLLPLIVRYGDDDRYQVIAGKRRLRALREVFKGQNPKVACTLKAVEGDAADEISLAENFVRETMHPLDEAEAFAKLAKDDGKGAADIAAHFGLPPEYVHRRMKLSILAEVVKNAYRQGSIDTATAEAFSAVPAHRQEEIWAELKGPPHNALHVRGLIAHAWIDAQHAPFDVGTLPEGTVSRDLFGDRILVERKAFMEKQAEALQAHQQALKEDGWKDVVVGSIDDVRDRLFAMTEAPVEFDDKTTRKLAKLQEKQAQLEKALTSRRGGNAGQNRIRAQLATLDVAAQRLVEKAQTGYAEATKAIGTTFLILDPEGRGQREYRIPRPPTARGNGRGRGASVDNGDNGHPATAPKPPTLAVLSDPQQATLCTQQAIAVRAALLDHPLARKRLLVMMLHEKVRSEALAIRHDPNVTTLHADKPQGFDSPALKTLRTRLSECDPFKNEACMDDAAAYGTLLLMSEKELDNLIAVLTVESLTAHLNSPTALVGVLADELKVDVRQQWKPDETWLSGYTKLQLADLLGTLRGPAYGNAALKAKKSELVAQATTLFADAAEGKLSDAVLAKRVNAWLTEGVLKEAPTSTPERKEAA